MRRHLVIRPSCGDVAGLPQEATLLVNVRAKIDPERLRGLTEKCLAAAAGDAIQATTEDLQSFAPSRPTPTHRFRCVI